MINAFFYLVLSIISEERFVILIGRSDIDEKGARLPVLNSQSRALEACTGMSANTHTDVLLAGAFAAFTVDLLIYPLDTVGIPPQVI